MSNLWFRRQFPVLLAVALFAVSGPLSGEPKTLVLAADEWAPFNMVPGSAQEGYIIDIVRAVFEPLDYRVDYRIIPWNRTLDGVRAGLYDAAVGASKSDAEGFVFPAEELAINRLGFFTTTRSRWDFTGHDSIGSVSLAVIDGYDYRQWLSEYIAANKDNALRVQVMHGDVPLEKNLRKLLDYRVDVVVDSTTAVRSTAKTLGILDKIRLAGEDNEPALIYVAFSPAKPGSPELARLLSEGIKKLRKNGQLKTILARYGLEDWKQ